MRTFKTPQERKAYVKGVIDERKNIARTLKESLEEIRTDKKKQEKIQRYYKQGTWR